MTDLSAVARFPLTQNAGDTKLAGGMSFVLNCPNGFLPGPHLIEIRGLSGTKQLVAYDSFAVAIYETNGKVTGRKWGRVSRLARVEAEMTLCPSMPALLCSIFSARAATASHKRSPK